MNKKKKTNQQIELAEIQERKEMKPTNSKRNEMEQKN